MKSYAAAAKAQGRQQSAMKGLTWILVISTVIYTAISGVVAYEMPVGNKVQVEMAAAAREANELQRQAMANGKSTTSDWRSPGIPADLLAFFGSLRP